MPGRVLSEPEGQPADVPARVAPAGVPAGRVPATKVASSGVPASVLRLCRSEKTHHRQQDRNDAWRAHKEGSSNGHGLPTPGNVVPVYSCSGWSGACDFQLSAVSLRKRIPVEAIDISACVQGYVDYLNKLLPRVRPFAERCQPGRGRSGLYWPGTSRARAHRTKSRNPQAGDLTY